MRYVYLDTTEIARLTGLSRPTVRKYRQEHEKVNGRLAPFFALVTRMVDGRPRKLALLHEDCVEEFHSIKADNLSKRGQKQ